MVREEAELGVQVTGSCPECAGAYAVDLWACAHVCAFCGSLLVFDRDPARDIYAISDGERHSERALELLIRHEGEGYRARLTGAARGEGPLALDPPSFDRQVEAFCRKLGGELTLETCVEFFVPYRIREQAVAQGVLGRRKRAKESFLQLFHIEVLERAYDDDAFHLRDRGLKIRGSTITRLTREHLELAEGRFLEAARAGDDPDAIELDHTRRRVRHDQQVIHRSTGAFRRRELLVFKHYSYLEVRRRRTPEHYLIDRQFGTIAAELDAGEARSYLRIAPRELPELSDHGDARAFAAECPNCGWELELRPHERIHFCATCYRAVSFEKSGLTTVPYRVAQPPEETASPLVYMPYWAFPFGLRAGGADFSRIQPWLEAVCPEQRSAALAESDPDPSLLYVPAIELYGSREADAAFELLASYASWRQPVLSRDRPVPDQRAQFAAVELDATEAARLARTVLVALHDNWSTRKLNAANFRTFINDVELRLGEPQLVALPLPISNDRWKPDGLTGSVPGPLLRGEARPRLLTVSHPLRPRSRRSS